MIAAVVVLLLMLANGVFAMAEIAIVSSNRARLRQLAEKGAAGARAALELSENPSRFLSTVQVGITLVGILAGAFGGGAFSAPLADLLKPLPVLGSYAEPVAFTAIVALLTYLSLVIGELVPKRFALRAPEAMACRVARPMASLADAVGPLVKLLTLSTDGLLRLFGLQSSEQKGVTREDLTVLAREGLVAGVLAQQESDMLEGVLDLAKLDAADIMTPKPDVLFIDADATHDQVWHRIVASNRTFFPVYRENPDNVVGVVSLKAIFANISGGLPAKLGDLAVEPLYVPESQPALKTLETMRKHRRAVALVADEFGAVRGMVTLNDLFEEIVGELPPDTGRRAPRVRLQEPGRWIADGLFEIDQLRDAIPDLPASIEQEGPYHTLAGFVIHHLERIPHEGDAFEWGGFRFEVVDMDGQRIDKVLVSRQPTDKPQGGS